MNFKLTEEHSLVKNSAREFALNELLPGVIDRDEKKLWPKETWNKLHLQIIFFGREYCPARNHNLKECPICSWAASKKRIAQEMKV